MDTAVEGDFVYSRHTATRQRTYAPGANKGGEQDNQDIVLLRKKVENARVAPDAPRLFSHGFEVFKCPTALPTQGFYDDNQVKDVNYNEISNLVKAVTGASRVVPFHHQVRTSEVKTEINPSVGPPAGVAHCDYTTRVALDIFDKIVYQKGEKKGRFCVINAWRNIAEYPIPNHHLACCDARSVISPDDYVFFDLHKPNEVIESYRLDSGHHQNHKWYYYPAMQKDEVLLFVQYDSDPFAKARYTFHSSFQPRPIPPASSPAPPRQSLEIRLLALFPDHEPNTLPDFVMTSGEKTYKIFQKLLTAVKSPEYWPQDAVNWMKLKCHTDEGIKEIVQTLVEEGAKKGEHGLDACSPEEREEIKTTLLESEEFVTSCRQNFPPLPAAEGPVIAIMGAISHPDKWPIAASTWLASIVHQPGGGRRAAQMMVANSAQKGEHGLAGATPLQQQQVVEKLLQQGFEEKARKNFPQTTGTNILGSIFSTFSS